MLLFRLHGRDLEPFAPSLPEPDGLNVFTLEQAAAKTGRSVDAVREAWLSKFGHLLPTTGVIADPAAATMPTEQRDRIIHETLFPQLSPEFFQTFKAICGDRGFSLTSRQLFPETQFDAHTGKLKLVVIAGITALGAIAVRTGDYDGPEPFEYVNEDGEVVDRWDDRKGPPVAARAGVRRKSFSRPVYADAQWSTYAPYTPAPGGPVLDPIWEKQGSAQLAKCALALALRTAFPDELCGLYSVDEMRQARSFESTTSRPPMRITPAASTAAADPDSQAGEDDVSEEEFNDLLSQAVAADQREKYLLQARSKYRRLWLGDKVRFYRAVAGDLRALAREREAG